MEYGVGIFWTGSGVEPLCLDSQRRTEEWSTECYVERVMFLGHETTSRKVTHTRLPSQKKSLSSTRYMEKLDRQINIKIL